jgi:hypothetical protein
MPPVWSASKQLQSKACRNDQSSNRERQAISGVRPNRSLVITRENTNYAARLDGHADQRVHHPPLKIFRRSFASAPSACQRARNYFSSLDAIRT